MAPAELTIFPKPPFNFDLLTALFAKWWPSHFIENFAEGCYERTLESEVNGSKKIVNKDDNDINLENKIFLIRVSSRGGIEKPKLFIKTFPVFDKAENISESEKKWIAKTVKWIFSTDDDLSGFYELISKYPAYKDMLKNLKGLKPPKTPTIFEAAIIAISEQEISLRAATAIGKRLIEKYGRSFFIDGKKYYTFPTAAALSKTKPEDIRELGFTFKKGQYMIELANRILSGGIDLEAMKNWKTVEIISELGKIKGFGPWTIKYILQRGFGRFEMVQFEDVGLRNGLTAILGKKEKISEKEAKDFFEPFGNYKGYFALYLLFNYLLHL